MVSLQQIKDLEQQYQDNPNAETYSLYRQAIDQYNQPAPPVQQPTPTATNIPQASQQTIKRIENIQQQYSRGKISEEEAQKLMGLALRVDPSQLKANVREAEEFRRRFESYDEIGKVAFFIKNPDAIEQLPDQKSKDEIRSAIAYGQNYIDRLLRRDIGAKSETATGIFLGAGGSDYRVINEYLARYREAQRQGDQEKMAEYYDYMVSRATALKLNQLGFNLGGYIISQPLTQYALGYLLARGLIKLPKPAQYGVGGALIAAEAPQAVEAVKAGKTTQYIKQLIPAFAGGAVAGAASRTPRQIATLYKPTPLKGPTYFQKAYTGAQTRFPTLSRKFSPYVQKVKGFKPFETYLFRRTKIRAGYRPSTDIPMYSRNVYDQQFGITRKYVKTEIFRGRGKRGLISPTEIKKYKPGVYTEPSMQFKFTYQKTPTKTTGKAEYVKLLEKTEITPPKKFLFWRKTRRTYGYTREQAYTLQTHEAPQLKGKVTGKAEIKFVDESIPITPEKPAWTGIKELAQTPYLKKTRFGKVKDVIPTESKYQTQLEYVLGGMQGKPAKARFHYTTLQPEQILTYRKPTIGKSKPSLQYRGEVFKVPTETLGETASHYAQFGVKYGSSLALSFDLKPSTIQQPDYIKKITPLEIETPAKIVAQDISPLQMKKVAQRYEFKVPELLVQEKLIERVSTPYTMKAPFIPTAKFLPYIPQEEKKKKQKIKLYSPKKLKYREKEYKIKPFTFKEFKGSKTAYKPKQVKINTIPLGGK